MGVRKLGEQEIERLIDKISRYTEIEDDKEKRGELEKKVKEYIRRKGRVDIVVPVLPSYPPWPPHILLYQKLSEIQDSLVKIHVVWGYSFLKAHTELAYPIDYIERLHKALMKVFNVDIDRIEFIVDSQLIDLYYNRHRLSGLFRDIVNSINIVDFYRDYFEKRGGFYRYYSKRPKVGGAMVSDFMSMLATIFYTIEDLSGGIVIVGRDKESIIDYLQDLLRENPYAKEYIEYLYIIYLPEIEAFYKIREHEPQLPGPEDSRDVIRRRLRHCDAKDLKTLIKFHCRDEEIKKKYCGIEDISSIEEEKDYSKLIDVLSQFYFKVYEDMKRNSVGLYDREIKFINKDEIKTAIEVLSKPRLDILGIIYKKYMENERGVRLSEIQRDLSVEGGGVLKLSTIKYHIDKLKNLGLVEELIDSETGKIAYKPSCSRIVIEIDLQKLFGVGS